MMRVPVYAIALASVRGAIDGDVENSHNLSQIINWSDEPTRTLGEVTDLLRSVAKDLRNEA
jgi:hypothetical protein